MDYPREFDKATRAKLVAAEIEASRQVMMSRSLFSSGELIVGTAFRLESSHVFQYILTMFHAFAIEACALGRNGEWTADRIDCESRNFLRLMTIQAQYKYGSRSEYFLPQMISPTSGSIIPEILTYFEDSPAWQRYQGDLLVIARLQSQQLSGAPHPIALDASKAALAEQDSANARLLKVERTEKPIPVGSACCMDTDGRVSEAPKETGNGGTGSELEQKQTLISPPIGHEAAPLSESALPTTDPPKAVIKEYGENTRAAIQSKGAQMTEAWAERRG